MQKKENITNKRFLIFILLFILGVVHWYFFMNFGEPKYNFIDWKLSYQFYDTIKQSVTELRFPYHATMFDLPKIQYGETIYESIVGGVNIRWVAQGVFVISPHLILLSVFEVPTIITLSVILFFSIGFWGILLWINKLKLSIPASIFLISIWSFNGYIVSKMGVGQIGMCNAYLFVPMFFWLLYQFIHKQDMNWKENVKNVILFSLFIFFAKLNANGQNVYQFLLVGSVVIFFYPRQWFWYACAVVLSMLLMTFYIAPTAMFSTYMLGDRFMQSGYGRGIFEITSMQWGLEKIIYHIFNMIYHLWSSLAVPFNVAIAGGRQWEFNLYVSLFGFVLLCCCSVAFFIQSYKTKLSINLRIFFAFCIISILSLSNISIEIHNLIVQYIVDYPLVDRLPSRLAVYSLSLIFLVAALGFDYFFQIFPSKIREVTKYIAVIVLLYFLFSHSYEWFVISAQESMSQADLVLEMQDERRFFKTSILNMPGDQQYINIVNISYLTSFILAFLSLFVLFFIREKKNHT